MVATDNCFVLHRFPVGELSLLAKCYCYHFGRRDFLIPDYFDQEREDTLLGFFEPFNLLKVDFEEKNGAPIVLDASFRRFVTSQVVRNLEMFYYLSKVSLTVLKFIRDPDREIFKLLETSLEINSFFEFNLIRFWLNLATILGFSIENLNNPGWVNLLTLKKCNPNEIKNPYCIYISPREFSTIKRILNKNTKPFGVPTKIFRQLEALFFKFFAYQNG